MCPRSETPLYAQEAVALARQGCWGCSLLANLAVCSQLHTLLWLSAGQCQGSQQPPGHSCLTPPHWNEATCHVSLQNDARPLSSVYIAGWTPRWMRPPAMYVYRATPGLTAASMLLGASVLIGGGHLPCVSTEQRQAS